MHSWYLWLFHLNWKKIFGAINLRKKKNKNNRSIPNMSITIEYVFCLFICLSISEMIFCSIVKTAWIIYLSQSICIFNFFKKKNFSIKNVSSHLSGSLILCGMQHWSQIINRQIYIIIDNTNFYSQISTISYCISINLAHTASLLTDHTKL